MTHHNDQSSFREISRQGEVRCVEMEDPGSWDRFVAESEKPHIMQSWGWGELKARSGWRPFRWAVERAGGWRTGLSFLERDFPRVGRRFLYAARGPIVREGWQAGDLRYLFQTIENYARRQKVIFLKVDPDVTALSDWISPHLKSSGFVPAPETGGFSGIQPRCVFRLNIDRPLDELLAGMDSKTRYNIHLAERKNIRIRPVDSRADIETFYRLLTETARRDGFLIRSAEYFLSIQELLVLRGQAQFFLAETSQSVPAEDAEKGRRPLAGALAFRMGPLCWYAYGASSTQDRQFMPNHLMQWTLIQWAKQQGCRVYDFRAVPCDADEHNPLFGLYRFKKGFGGVLTQFIGEYDRIYSPPWYRFWTQAWPLFKKIRFWVKGRKTRGSE